MTPTLLGRIHTRVFLTVVLGVPITLPFALIGLGVPFLVLGLVLLVGLALDPVYHLIQQRRWDHDWPVWAQAVAGLVEGVLVFLLHLPLVALLGAVTGGAGLALACVFPLHYGLVWVAIFLAGLGPMRVLFPRSRYRGGELGRGRRWHARPGARRG